MKEGREKGKHLNKGVLSKLVLAYFDKEI